MESPPQNPEFRINPSNFHPCRHSALTRYSMVLLRSIQDKIGSQALRIMHKAKGNANPF